VNERLIGLSLGPFFLTAAIGMAILGAMVIGPIAGYDAADATASALGQDGSDAR
jgi:hypothetical protein